MALKVKMKEYTKWQKNDSLMTASCVEGQDYSFPEFVDRLKKLRQAGYLYETEQVFENGREALWQENSLAPMQAQVSESWQQKRVTEIVLHFAHLITGEKLYLHLHWAEYPKKELGRTVMQIVGSNPTAHKTENISRLTSPSPEQADASFAETTPYFEALLYSMDLMPIPNKWYDISTRALQATDNDSLLTTLAKYHYTQQRTGKLSELAGKKNALHWAGEFVKTDVSATDNCYLYLLITETDLYQEGVARIHCELTPEIRVLSSSQPLEEITIPGVGVLSLEKMPWEGLPFAGYYDLPNDLHMLVRTPMKEYGPDPENIHAIFQKLYEEGYRYRREIAMVEGCDTCADDTFLEGYDVNPEYLAHGLYSLTLEFIHPDTRCRKIVIISPTDITVRLCNGNWGADMGHHYSCHFQDSPYNTRRFSDSPETKSPFREEEIFPAPLLESLLNEHHLIAPDQIAIRRMMENTDYRDWFSASILDHCYWYGPSDFDSDEDPETESPDERRESIKSHIARCRRIFRHLHYPLAGTRTIHEGMATAEVYANSTVDRAFFLVYDEYNYFVKFVDKYMDVDWALAFQ